MIHNNTIGYFHLISNMTGLANDCVLDWTSFRQLRSFANKAIHANLSFFGKRYFFLGKHCSPSFRNLRQNNHWLLQKQKICWKLLIRMERTYLSVKLTYDMGIWYNNKLSYNNKLYMGIRLILTVTGKCVGSQTKTIFSNVRKAANALILIWAT